MYKLRLYSVCTYVHTLAKVSLRFVECTYIHTLYISCSESAMSEEVPITNTTLPFPFPCQLGAWCVAVGSKVHKGSLLCSCVQSVGVGVGGSEGGKEEETTLQIKSGVVGIVRELLYSPGDIVQPG